MTHGNQTWSDERVETLKRLWLSGHAASEIAKIMPGTTRNMVIGKASRLGLSNRLAPQRQPYVRPPRVRTPVPKPVVVVPDAPDPIGPLDTLLTGNVCKFIAGDVAVPGWQMCGHPATKSFCEFHQSICYVKQMPRKSSDELKSLDAVSQRYAARMGMG